MQKLTQRELLESFGDIMKKISNVVNSDTAQALGAAAKTAATTFAPEFTRPLGRVAEPFKKTVNAFRDNKPSTFVAQKLKTEYSSTFNTRTLKIDPVAKPDPQNSNRSIIEFEADQFKRAGGTQPRQKYRAFVTRGGKDKSLTMEVFNSRGQSIRGSVVNTSSNTIQDAAIKLKSYSEGQRMTGTPTITLEELEKEIKRNYANLISTLKAIAPGNLLTVIIALTGGGDTDPKRILTTPQLKEFEKCLAENIIHKP